MSKYTPLQGMSAIAGFSKIQWQNLANGLVKSEK